MDNSIIAAIENPYTYKLEVLRATKRDTYRGAKKIYTSDVHINAQEALEEGKAAARDDNALRLGDSDYLIVITGHGKLYAAEIKFEGEIELFMPKYLTLTL